MERKPDREIQPAAAPRGPDESPRHRFGGVWFYTTPRLQKFKKAFYPNLPWSGGDGAKGEVQLKLISETSLEVVWSATQLGRTLGLAAGSAVLVRRAEP